MRPYILLSLILIMQWTAFSQQDASGQEVLAMATPYISEIPSEATPTLPKASFVQGQLEVIPLHSDESCTIKVSAFPNPIKKNVTLLTFGNKGKSLKYKLMEGDKVVFVKNIVNSKESIEIENYDAENYILSITASDKEVKSFKIIKH